MSVSFSQNVFSSDGSTLSRWNNNGITISSGFGNPAPSFSSTGSVQYAYTICLPSLVGYTILVDMYATGATPLINLYFGCNFRGAGQMFRLDARGGNLYSGFATTHAWTNPPGWDAPTSPINLNINTWYTIKIVINSTATNGMSWYYNNTFGANGTFVDNGGYIGLHGDGGTGGYWDNISIYPNAYTIPASVSLSSPFQLGLLWSSYDGYFADNVNYFSTATLRSIGGVYRGTSSVLTNVSTATNGIWGVNANETYSIEWVGYFLAPQTGTYTWTTNSDDASYLWIGPNAISGYTTANATVNNGGLHGMQVRTGTATLTAGVYYPIRIQFGENGGGDDMRVYFILPDYPSTMVYNGTGFYFNDGKLNGVLVSGVSVGEVLTNLIPSSINLSLSNTDKINSLILGKQPWGIYDATFWNPTTNTLPEARGNGRDVTRPAGTVTYGTGSGNGSTVSIPYISGTTATKLLWPAGSIPANFTICSITRYTGGTNARILTSTGYTVSDNNWLHGHHGTCRGVAYYEGASFKTQYLNIGSLTNWLVMCGNNGNPTPNNILVDSVAKGVNSGGTGGGTYTLSINMYGSGGTFYEPSDWAFTYLVIYDTNLTDAEMLTVSNKLLSYLQNGYM